MPLIKCKVSGVKVDLVFGQAGETQVPSEGEEGTMDSRTSSIMKGPRNVRMIRELLGSQMGVYLRCLRVVKYWAKQQGIYSHICGYLGGIQLAVMLAKVCLLRRECTCPLELLKGFFKLYSTWNLRVPISLSGVQESSESPLTIYAPADPSFNTAHSVSTSTIRVIRNSLRRASLQMNKHNSLQLCKPFEFLREFTYYLKVQLIGPKGDTSLPQRKGHVMSKLKRLVDLLESSCSVETRLSPNALRETHGSSDYIYYLMGLRVKGTVMCQSAIDAWKDHHGEQVQVHLLTLGQLEAMLTQEDLRDSAPPLIQDIDAWRQVMRNNGIICHPN